MRFNASWITLLAFIALSAAQSSAQTHIHSATLVIDTSNNASYNQVHWLVRTPYLSIKASNVVARGHGIGIYSLILLTFYQHGDDSRNCTGEVKTNQVTLANDVLCFFSNFPEANLPKTITCRNNCYAFIFQASQGI